MSEFNLSRQDVDSLTHEMREYNKQTGQFAVLSNGGLSTVFAINLIRKLQRLEDICLAIHTSKFMTDDTHSEFNTACENSLKRKNENG